MMNTINQTSKETLDRPVQGKKRQELAPGFEGAMAMAAAQNAPQPAPATAIAVPGLLEKASEGVKAAGTETKGESPKAVATDAKALGAEGNFRSPVLDKHAASMKTAAAIAGLKPWSTEWVFQGGGDAVKPLFSAGPETAAGLDRALSAGGPEGMPRLDAEGLEPLARGQGGVETAQLLAALAAQQQPEGEASGLQRSMRGKAGSNPAANAAGIDAADLTKLGGQLDAEFAPGTVNAEWAAQAGGGAGAMEGGKKPQGLSNNLSGGEFLSTLSAVKAGGLGAAGGQNASGRFSGNGSGEGGAGRQLAGKPDLRVIEGGGKGRKARGAELGEALAPPAAATHFALHDRGLTPKSPTEVTGHVTSGAMAQDRLSSESLTGLSAGIRNMAPNGGGEIRIRLRPEHLGELHLKVVTHGNDVRLNIQATDERAKKILEDSMSHLKDSLASQHLTLGRVELSVAQAAGSANPDFRNDTGTQAGQQGFQEMKDMLGQNAGHSQQGRSDSWSDSSAQQPRATAPAGIASQTARAGMTGGAFARTSSANGRLDVRA